MKLSLSWTLFKKSRSRLELKTERLALPLGWRSFARSAAGSLSS